MDRSLISPTRAEGIVRDFFHFIGLPFSFQKEFSHNCDLDGYERGVHRFADFFVPCLNLIVEVDGSSHYYGEDGLKDRAARQHGLRTFRVKNQEVYAEKFPDLFKAYLVKVGTLGALELRARIEAIQTRRMLQIATAMLAEEVELRRWVAQRRHVARSA
jgi:hypothetical protein